MAYDLDACRKKNAGNYKKIPASKVIAWIERNFDYKVRKGGAEYRICNPFDSDTNFKMNINPESLGVHCWTGDEWAGPINPLTQKRNCSFVKFVKLYRKCSYADAIREILGSTEDIRDYLRPAARSVVEDVKKIVVALPDGVERIADNQHDHQAKIVTDWLMKRGYTLEDIDKHDIHHLGVDCYWPYYEFDELIYWQSRNRYNKIYRFPDMVVYDRAGTVVGETQGSKGDFLYGFDDCKSASYLSITESIFCQYTLGEQVLASGGAILTPTQVGKIKIIGPRKGIILSPDNDAAGIKSILSNQKLLSSIGCPLYYSIPPRIRYQKAGETKFIKDFNELFEELHMSRTEIRELHDKNIKSLNVAGINALHSLLKVNR